MFHPTRGGTRGGQDQFKWEDVKEDKHRENYLGNSLLAPVGRWQKGRDLTWYAKANNGSGDNTSEQDKKRAEIQNIKDAEAQAMAEALGYKTAKRKTESNVTEHELQSAIHKNDPGLSDELDGKLQESSRIQGLGFNRRPGMAMESQKDAFRTNLIKPATTIPLIPATARMPVTNDSERESRAHAKQSSREHRSAHRRSSRSASPSRKSSKHGRDRSRSRDRAGTRDRREPSHRSKDDDSLSRRRSSNEDKGAKDNRDRGHRGDERRSERRSRSPRVRHPRSERVSRDDVTEAPSTRERRRSRSRSNSRSRSRDRRREGNTSERRSKSRKDEWTRS